MIDGVLEGVKGAVHEFVRCYAFAGNIDDLTKVKNSYL